MKDQLQNTRMVFLNVISPSVVGCYQFFGIGITLMFLPEGGGSMFLQGTDTRLRIINKKTASTSDLIQVMQYTIAEKDGSKCSQEKITCAPL